MPLSRRLPTLTLWLAALVVAPACDGARGLPPAAQVGPDPPLPAPSHRLIPRVDIAPAVGWPGAPRRVPPPGWR